MSEHNQTHVLPVRSHRATHIYPHCEQVITHHQTMMSDDFRDNQGQSQSGSQEYVLFVCSHLFVCVCVCVCVLALCSLGLCLGTKGHLP